MRHALQDLAVKLLGKGKAFSRDARLVLTKAYLAAGCEEGATRGLIELSSAWKKSGREDAACTLAVLVMSGAPMLAARAAKNATEATQRAESSARKLFGATPISMPSAPPSGGVQARFVRFTTREG